MATAYTSLLGLALPVTGEISGTWGDTVNNAITSLLDSAVAGTTTLSTDADVTLTTTTGATNQARQAILLCSGARTAIRNITAPAQSKMYVVINNTTGGYGVVIRGAGPTTGVTVANGKTAVVVWNGSDFVEVAPAVATNLSGGTAGALPYQTAANTTAFLSIGTNNFVLTSNGTAPVWTTNTGTGNVVRATSPTITTPTITTSITAPLLIGGTGTTSTLALRSTSGAGTTGADIIFQTGNNGATEAMRILNSGNVGIGTSSPAQLLHVLGTSTKALIATSSSTGFASVQTQSDGGTNDLEIVQYGTAATSTYFGVNRAGAAFLGASATTFGMGTKGASPVILATNNTERLRIDSSGNVGIGTSSPQVKLDVVGAIKVASSGAVRVTLDSTDINIGSIQFNANGAARSYFGGANWAVTPPASANDTALVTAGVYNLIFGTNTAERVRIDSSGNVGIGTSNPGQKLQVAGNIKIEDTYSLFMGVGSEQRIFAAGTSNNTYLTFSQWVTSSYTERMRIDSNGNVGIGISSPARMLHVSSTNPSAFFDRDGGNPGAIGLRGSRGTLSAPTQSLANDTLGAVSGFGYTSASSFTSAGIANMAFYAAEALTSTAQGSYITFSTTSIGTATPSERMLISSAGNVGIGVTSPASKLEVSGVIRSSGASTLLAATDGAATSTDATGFGYASVNTSATTGSYTQFGFGVVAGDGTGQNAYLRAVSTASGNTPELSFLQRVGNTIVERMRINSAGNVGIGTASPVNKLDVFGSFGRGAPVTKTTNFTLAATENWVICNGAGTITVTLPAASSWTGREVMIKTIAAQTVVSASSNVVPLTGGAAGTAILAATAGKWATLVSDGTNWVIMSAA